jgi:hypothetical protein
MDNLQKMPQNLSWRLLQVDKKIHYKIQQINFKNQLPSQLKHKSNQKTKKKPHHLVTVSLASKKKV